MNVTLCSAFRNASNYAWRSLAQIRSLECDLDERGDSLHLVVCEGDSTDDTSAALFDALDCEVDADVFHYSHGGPDFGSIVHPDRFANLARVWNTIWARIPEDADAVLFVESDLAWESATMLALLDRLADVPAVAPMVMLRRDGFPVDYFYDTWAFRKDGKHFGTLPPYNDWLGGDLMQLDSAGSCMAIRGDLARQLTWPEADVIVGVCRQIRELGQSVWLDPALKVIHE